MAMMQWCGAMARRMMSTHRMSLSASSTSPSSSSAASELIACGRGDKRTKRGKRFKGAFGNARPKRKQMIQRFKDKVETPRSTPWPLPFKLI